MMNGREVSEMGDVIGGHVLGKHDSGLWREERAVEEGVGP